MHFTNDGFDPYNPKKQENNKEWIGAAIGAAASLASNAVNYFSQKKANKENAAFAQEQFDYQKQLNALTMERQDSAFQRAVEDAQKAGLSPLVAAGAPAQSGGVSSSQLSLGQVAPQIESNTFGDMMRVLAQESMQKRQISNENASREDSQSHEEMMQQARLDAANETLEKQLENENSQRNIDRIQDMIKFNKQQQFMIDSKNADYLAQMSQESMKSAQAMGVLKFTDFDNPEEVRAHNAAVLDEAQSAYDKAYNDALKENQGFDTVELTESDKTKGSLNAGVYGALNGEAGKEQGAQAKGTRNAVERGRSAYLEVLNRRGYGVYVPRVGSSYSGSKSGFGVFKRSKGSPYGFSTRQRER